MKSQKLTRIPKSIKIRFVCEASTGGNWTTKERKEIRELNRAIDILLCRQKILIKKGWKK